MKDAGEFYLRSKASLLPRLCAAYFSARRHLQDGAMTESHWTAADAFPYDAGPTIGQAALKTAHRR